MTEVQARVGQRRLVQRIRRALLHRAKSATTSPLTDIAWSVEIFRMRLLKILRILTRPRFWHHLQEGPFPSLEHVRTPFAPDYGTVFDVGASRGQFASFAKGRWPSAQLFCFEPLPSNAAQLKRIVSGRGFAFQVALGDREGHAELVISGREDSSSLFPIGRLVQKVPDAREVGRQSVKIERLENFCNHLGKDHSLLKIDVQGSELAVLQGAGDSLQQFSDIYCECSFVELYQGQPLATEVIAYLSLRGFDLIAIENVAREHGREVLQADLLFRRKVPTGTGTTDTTELRRDVQKLGAPKVDT